MGHIGKDNALVQFHAISPYISSFLQTVDPPTRNVLGLSVVSNHGKMSVKNWINSKDLSSSGI